MNRRFVLLGIISLSLLTSITYLPALNNGFIWDDDDHLTNNRAVASSSGIRQIWSSLAVSRYYPLTLTSFWVQRRIWGLSPMPYHAVNIALHAINAALLYVVLKRLSVRGAWAAAAIWAVHPVNVESVAWVTELKNIQAAFFFFLSLLSYLQIETQARREREKLFAQNKMSQWYTLSLLCFVAALSSKPSTVVLPLVLLLVTWWECGRLRRIDFIRAAPFFALSAAMSLLTIIEQQREVVGAGQESLNLTERLVLAGKAVWFYAGKILWPVHSIFVYPRWSLNSDSLWSLLPWVGIATVGFVLWRYRGEKWAEAAAFGLACFIIGLLPVMGFFNIYYFRYSFVADHFQYLASVGVIALVSAGCAVLIQQRRVQYIPATTALAVLATLSWRHIHVFHDQETLWRDTMAKNPRAAIAYNNLGVILNFQKQYEKAIGYFEEALRLRPDQWEAHSNIGVALTELGRYDEALVEFHKALRIRPDFANAHYRLAVLYMKMKRFNDAEQEYLLAIHYNPFMPEPYFELGVVSEKLGKRAAAVEAYREAVRLEPNYAFAHNNLANLLAENGQLDEAVQHYRKALTADPSLQNAQQNLLAIQRLQKPQNKHH